LYAIGVLLIGIAEQIVFKNKGYGRGIARLSLIGPRGVAEESE
jgi:hypothetical protein